jgi:hypothetical protein
MLSLVTIKDRRGTWASIEPQIPVAPTHTTERSSSFFDEYNSKLDAGRLEGHFLCMLVYQLSIGQGCRDVDFVNDKIENLEKKYFSAYLF